MLFTNFEITSGALVPIFPSASAASFRTCSLSSFKLVIKLEIESSVAIPILPKAKAASFRIETSSFLISFDISEIAISASFPIRPSDLTDSRHILQSSSLRHSINSETPELDFWPISPKTIIALNRIDLISLPKCAITSFITFGSFSIRPSTRSTRASLNNFSKEAEILSHLYS